ncbi:MAG TPA: dihydroorotate dehydrogenase [Acidimicrobiia bacterium]
MTRRSSRPWRTRTTRDAVLRRTPDASVRLGPLVLPGPIVAASGTFGHGDEVARLCDPAELGAVTVKSLAPYEWPGNPAPRLHMTDAGMLNSVGLEGPGVETWVSEELPALRARGARVIASVWGRTVDDFAVAAKMLHPARSELVAVEVNVSCPNLEDRSRMFAHAPDTTAAAVGAVADAGLGLPLFAKLSPNIADLTDVAAASLGAGATGLTLINTVIGLLVDAERRRPVLGGGGGGLSGPAIKPVALRIVADVARAYPDVPIIGTGGVTTGLDAVEMLMAGASAVGVGTATFHDPRAALRIGRELADWCLAHGVDRVSDLTGAMEYGDA